MSKPSNRLVKAEMENEAVDIKIIVKNEDDIFEHLCFRSLDDKEINSGLETYIISSIKNYPLKRKIRIVFSFLEEKEQTDIAYIEKTVHTHFKYKAEETALSLKQQFRQWRINMAIGLLFLILCLVLVEVLERLVQTNIVKIMKESLLIIGWVALWEPITFILFGWRTIKRNKECYQKLSEVPVLKESL